MRMNNSERRLYMVKELEQYVKLVGFLSDTLGSTFEAGLFDLTDPAYPLITAANSQSSIQEEVRAFVTETVGSRKAQADSCLTNRPIEIGFGKMLKVSVFFIRNTEGKAVGALWISMRCDFFLKLDAFATSMLQFNVEDMDAEEEEIQKLPTATRKPSLDTIIEVIDEFGIEPGRMSMAERQEIICDLYDMGVYNLKGAVAMTAEALQVSEQSVYRYIAKIKKARDW